MKSTKLLQFITVVSLLSVTYENYIIDDHEDLSSLSVKVEYLKNRSKRLSDTSSIQEATNTTESTPQVEDTEKTGDEGSSSSGEEPGADETGTKDTSDSGHEEESADKEEDDNDGFVLPVDGDIEEYCKDNNNTCSVDQHKYYKAIYITEQSLWRDQWIELAPDENPKYNSTRHANLSTSEPKRGYTLQPGDFNLTDFMFYGQPASNITITILTGGFLHVGDIVSPKIVSIAQYIAPFMGNFNPKASNTSNVYYYSDEDIFIVQWDKMQIANKTEKGNFTFQLQLHKNNDIVFAYKELPEVTLSSQDHENAIGISDAFHIVSPNHLMIHVYHKLDVNKTKIQSGSAVRLQALKSCTMMKDCYNCTTQDLPEFECRWCSNAQTCMDKHGDGGYTNWWRECQVNYIEKGGERKCEEYCYLPPSSNHTTYTPAPSLPVIPADPKGGSRLKIQCDANYSVSALFPLSASNMFSCTSGGINLPTCKKSCPYTTPPSNGTLKGIDPGHQFKPDASFTVTCQPGHRLRNRENRNITCKDGYLEPDPRNVKCEKYCTLPHAHKAEYTPAPISSGYLHEDENITMTCEENYAFDAFLHGTQEKNSLVLKCGENSDFSNLAKMCVGYCNVEQHPNTTYDPVIAMIGQKITISCDNGTFLEETEEKQEYVCQLPGPLMIPACKKRAQPQEREVSTTGHSLMILLIIFILTVVCIVGGWVLYAYRNPTSPSGLFLIEKCRPWTWRSHTYSRHQESLAESYYMDGGI